MNALRLEPLLVVHMQLRHHPDHNRHWINEIERAIEKIQCGFYDTHTDCIEQFCAGYLAGVTA